MTEKPQGKRVAPHTMSDLHDLMQRLAGTETAFNEFKTSVGGALSAINHQLNILAQQITSIQKTPWGTLFSGIGALSALIIFFVFQPLQTAITQQAATIEAIKTAYIKSDDDTRALISSNEKYILEHTVSWREHEKLIIDIENMRRSSVTQAEFITHKEHHDEEMRGLRNELHELQERILYMERHAAPKG